MVFLALLLLLAMQGVVSRKYGGDKKINVEANFNSAVYSSNI